MRIELGAALFTTGILTPAGVANACERKVATLVTSALELASAITVLSVTVNDPVFGTSDTGKGIILIDGDVWANKE